MVTNPFNITVEKNEADGYLISCHGAALIHDTKGRRIEFDSGNIFSAVNEHPKHQDISFSRFEVSGRINYEKNTSAHTDRLIFGFSITSFGENNFDPAHRWEVGYFNNPPILKIPVFDVESATDNRFMHNRGISLQLQMLTPECQRAVGIATYYFKSRVKALKAYEAELIEKGVLSAPIITPPQTWQESTKPPARYVQPTLAL